MSRDGRSTRGFIEQDVAPMTSAGVRAGLGHPGAIVVRNLLLVVGLTTFAGLSCRADREALGMDLGSSPAPAYSGALHRGRKVGELAHIESPVRAKGNRGGHSVHERSCVPGGRPRADGASTGGVVGTRRGTLCVHVFTAVPMACKFLSPGWPVSCRGHIVDGDEAYGITSSAWKRSASDMVGLRIVCASRCGSRVAYRIRP